MLIFSRTTRHFFFSPLHFFFTMRSTSCKTKLILLRHSWTKYHRQHQIGRVSAWLYIELSIRRGDELPLPWLLQNWRLYWPITYLWCIKQIYTIMYPVGCRPIAYAESYRRIFIIVLVDTIHVRQSLEMRLLTSTYSTVITTENIVDINIILHTSQYSRSKQDNIQQSTLGVLE